jgi:hypothetical protein
VLVSESLTTLSATHPERKQKCHTR